MIIASSSHPLLLTENAANGFVEAPLKKISENERLGLGLGLDKSFIFSRPAFCSEARGLLVGCLVRHTRRNATNISVNER